MRYHCRVVITDHCNLSCDFCCMKDKKISHSFLPASMLDVALRRYDEVCITGGEPLLVLPKVMQFAALVRYFKRDVKIYLYTNGIDLTKRKAEILKLAGVDTLNVSFHVPMYSMNLIDLAYINKHLLGVRILVGEMEATETLLQFASANEMPVRIWKINECKDMAPEERWRIK